MTSTQISQNDLEFFQNKVTQYGFVKMTVDPDRPTGFEINHEKKEITISADLSKNKHGNDFCKAIGIIAPDDIAPN